MNIGKGQFSIREQDPLKQGLKHFGSRCMAMFFGGIREQDPLKQGLKLTLYSICVIISLIREQDPLKQGLKHQRLNLQEVNYHSDSRARSTKTRIETLYPAHNP